MLSLADDILATPPLVDPDMASLYARVRDSLEAGDEATVLRFDTSCVKASYHIARDDRSLLVAFRFRKGKLPRRCDWIEWTDHGQRLGLWWQRSHDESPSNAVAISAALDICCFLRTPTGETAMIGALRGYRFGSTNLKLTYSEKLIKNDAEAVCAISDYLRFFAAACALLNGPIGGIEICPK